MTHGATWGLVAGAFVVCGIGAGTTLDAVLWRLSRDYVYLPNEFLVNGGVLGLLAATVSAAFATMGGRPPAPLASVVRALGAAAAVLVLASVLGGVAGGLAGRRAAPAASERLLAPIARVWTCEGLWRGALVGSVVATALFCVMVRRTRRLRPV